MHVSLNSKLQYYDDRKYSEKKYILKLALFKKLIEIF